MPGGRHNSGRGRGGRSGRGRGGKPAERTEAQIKLSKKMSRMLRHHPPPSIDGSGWVPLADVMKSLLGGEVTLEDIQIVVNTDEKGRFQVSMYCQAQAPDQLSCSACRVQCLSESW